jgi:hypothetical protein
MPDVQPLNHPDVTLSFDEYHELVNDLQRAVDLHAMLRRMAPIVFGETVDANELADVRMHLDHFLRDYPVA